MEEMLLKCSVALQIAHLVMLCAIPGDPEGFHTCAVACRCECTKECRCVGGPCPVNILVTGSLSERAVVPIEGLRLKRIACPDVEGVKP